MLCSLLLNKITLAVVGQRQHSTDSTSWMNRDVSRSRKHWNTDPDCLATPLATPLAYIHSHKTTGKFEKRLETSLQPYSLRYPEIILRKKHFKLSFIDKNILIIWIIDKQKKKWCWLENFQQKTSNNVSSKVSQLSWKECVGIQVLESRSGYKYRYYEHSTHIIRLRQPELSQIAVSSKALQSLFSALSGQITVSLYFEQLHSWLLRRFVSKLFVWIVLSSEILYDCDEIL